LHLYRFFYYHEVAYIYIELIGIKKDTFDLIIDILKEAEKKKKKLGERKNKVYIEDRLLMTIFYLIEYCTYFYIAKSYGIAENICYRNITWIEDILSKHEKFSLSKKKDLLKVKMK